jgi:putative FmdB family regulatory protein
VPVYAYSCVACGGFELARPMAESAEPAGCPGCGGTGRRVFGAPALRSLDPGLRTALDAQHRSSDHPAVVSSLPPRSAGRIQRRASDPRQARLPRL